MAHVAGVDGARGGWAVVTMGSGPPRVRKVTSLLEMLDMRLKVIAVDVPIGLLDSTRLEAAPATGQPENFSAEAEAVASFRRRYVPFSGPRPGQMPALNPAPARLTVRRSASKHSPFSQRSRKSMNSFAPIPICAVWYVRCIPRCVSAS